MADFGLSKNADESALRTSRIGTFGFMAPELWSGVGSYTAAVDVWALGSVAFCVLVGEPPAIDVVGYTRQNSNLFPIEKLEDRMCSYSCVSFVQAALTFEPERRLTIEQLLASRWLAKLSVTTRSNNPSRCVLGIFMRLHT